LSIQIQDHILVPQHETLTDKETETLLEGYNISKGQLPKIFLNDPAIKKSGVKPGDVIKITRKSPTAGTTVVHKVVVKE